MRNPRVAGWSVRLPLVLLPVLLYLSVGDAAELVVEPPVLVAGGGLGEGARADAVSLLPASVLAGPDGTVWIADEQHNRVRALRPDGRVYSVAGSGAFGFNGDGLPALRSHLGVPADLDLDAAGHLYLVDLANRSVRVVGDDGALRTFVGPDHPLLTTVGGDFAPASVAIGPDGRVHVADRGTNVVWQFDPDGRGRRVAGDGLRGFAGDGAPAALGRVADPRAVAVSADGAIWIADTGNRRVRVVGPDGRLRTAAGDGGDTAPLTALTGPALGVSLKPVDVAVSAGGDVYVLDALGRQVLRLAPRPRFTDGALGGAVDVDVVHRFADEADPAALDVDRDGRVLIADRGRRQILILDPRVDGGPSGRLLVLAGNGAPRASGDGGPARDASLYAPAALVAHADGSLDIADSGNHLVRRVDAGGTILTLAGTGRAGSDAGQLRGPEGLAIDASGRRYIADTGNHRVLRREADGSATVVAGTGDAGQAVDGVGALEAALNTPTALAFDAAGRLLIVDAGNRVVRRLDADGALRTLAGNGGTRPVAGGGPATASALLRPTDIDIDDAGALWIADPGAHRVWRVDAAGVLRHVAGTGEAGVGAHGSRATLARLRSPTGVEADGAGGAFIADSGNDRIVHVDADGVLRHVAAVGRPQRLATAADGGLLVADGLAHRVWRIAWERRLAPAAERVVLHGAGLQLQALAAPDLGGLHQVMVDTTGAILLGSRGGLSRLGADGSAAALLSSEARRFRVTPAHVDGFGDALLLARPAGVSTPKPLTLIRFTPRGTERFDLDYLFAGADDAVTDVSGDVLLHDAAGGRLLRLPRERVLNVVGFPGAVGGVGVAPGGIEVFAALPPGPAALTPAPGGGVYVALQGSGEILWARDLDGDGLARGDAELERLARLPEAPVALATTHGDGLYAATATRLWQIDGDAALVGEGFAPRILDLAAAADGGLLVLEGDGDGGRLLRVFAAPPAVAIWPARIDFGAAEVGAEALADIWLRNEGLAPVRLTPSPAGGSPVLVDGLVLEPGEARRVAARWTPGAPGTVVDELVWRDPAGAELARTDVQIHGRAPRFEVPAALDLGRGWVGGRRVVELPVRNAGDATLRLEAADIVSVAGSASTGAAAFAAELPAGGPLEPGQEAIVRLTLTPTDRGAHEAILRLRTNDPVRPVRDIALTGHGGAAQLTVREVDLGAVPVGSRRTHDLVLENVGDMDLSIYGMNAGTRRLALTPQWLTVPAGQTRTVRIDFSPDAIGQVRGDLSLFTNDPLRRRWLLPYRGHGVSQLVELSAAAHDFGAVSGAARWELEIVNHQRRALHLLSARTDNAAFSLRQRPFEIAAGDTGRVVVDFAPAGSAAARGQLHLTTDLAAAQDIVVLLQGRTPIVGGIRAEVPAPALLWPGEEIRVPVHVLAARDLRGVAFTVSASAGLSIAGVDLPEAGLLHQAGEPLAVSNPQDGGLQVGVSATGGTVSGSGAVAVVRLRLDGPLGDSPWVRLSHIIARAGADSDTLAAAQSASLAVAVRGDLDGNGRLEAADALLLISVLVGDAPALLERHDLDGDGRVGPADFEVLRAHLTAAAKPLGNLGSLTSARLLPPYPNPFNAEVALVVALPEAGHVELAIHNLLGQRVRLLLDEERPAGLQSVVWDGRDASGRETTSGTYFAVMRTATTHRVQRLLLLR